MRALLRKRAAERTFEHAVADQILLARFGTVVVECVRGGFLAQFRVEGHVQQFRTVAVRAEHFLLDEAPAGEVALITENTIEFERMADRFVNLQHHLIGHQQQIPLARRAIRRGQQLQRFIGDTDTRTVEAEACQHFHAALPQGAVVAAEGTHLRVAVGVCGHAQLRHDELELLIDPHAVAGHVELIGMCDLHRCDAFDNACIEIRARAFHGEAV